VPTTLEQFVERVPTLTNVELVDWIFSLADTAARNPEAREEVDQALDVLLGRIEEIKPTTALLIASFRNMNQRLRVERDACRGDSCRLSAAMRIMSEGRAIGDRILAQLE
jgi:hypothetical protein